MSTTARASPRVALARGVARASASSTRRLPGPAGVPSRARVAPRASAAETSSYASKTVVCTREAGKNGALMNALKARGVRCLELPLVEAVPGDDADALPDVLTKERWDWVCVTSPEAAKVFLQGYEAAGRPKGVRVAVVGAATGRALAAGAPDAFALEKQFVPSKATAATMARELPCEQGSLILYPASKKAASTLEDGLEARGATVVRLNTYSTERVSSLNPADIARAVAADVVTFGSPSAVRAWVELCGDALYDHLVQNEDALQPAYVCIGETSAEACAACELPDVFYPENPGMEGWAETVFSALDVPISNRWTGVDLVGRRDDDDDDA